MRNIDIRKFISPVLIIFFTLFTVIAVLAYKGFPKNIYYNPYNIGFPFTFDPKLLSYRFLPSIKASVWGGDCSINSHGLRGDDFEFKKKENEIRIIALGDSCVFGSTVGDKDTYCYKLERILNEMRIDKAFTFRVINAGVPGYSSFRGMQYFKYYISRYSPDVLLIQFGWNDHWEECLTDRMDYYRTLTVNLLPKFLADFLSESEKNKADKKISINPVKLFFKVPPLEYIYNIKKTISLAKTAGAKNVVLITAPSEIRLYNAGFGYPFYLVAAAHERYVNLLKRFDMPKGTFLLDLHGIALSRFAPDPQYYFSDVAHFNEHGHTMEAIELYNFLNKNSILPDVFKKKELAMPDVLSDNREYLGDFSCETKGAVVKNKNNLLKIAYDPRIDTEKTGLRVQKYFPDPRDWSKNNYIDFGLKINSPSIKISFRITDENGTAVESVRVNQSVEIKSYGGWNHIEMPLKYFSKPKHSADKNAIDYEKIKSFSIIVKDNGCKPGSNFISFKDLCLKEDSFIY